MGRIYSVSYTGTITNAGGDTDLLEILPADDKPVKLRGFTLSQISEVGDAAEEGLRISVIRLPATVATTSSTAVTLEEIGWNIRNSPYEHWYPDAAYAPKVKQGEGLVVRQQTTAA